MKTPVLSLFNSPLSKSDFVEANFIYSSTSTFFSSRVSFSTNGCSGERTTYEAPNNVSGLVVYTVIFELSPLILKSTSHPSDLPIQFL